MNVPSSRMPLPQESFRSGSNSGSRPYLDGPKNALCMPINNTHASRILMLPPSKPASTSAITATSKTFTPTVTMRLLKRSARKPPAMENRMNGSENNAPTSSPILCFSAMDTFIPSSMKMTRFFSTLSLNAPWNCVTMRNQKPRWGTPVRRSAGPDRGLVRDVVHAGQAIRCQTKV